MTRRSLGKRAVTVALLLAAGWSLHAADPASPLVEIPITPQEREHWAYQPIAVVEPPAVADADWNRHPIDAFVRAQMQQRDLSPLPVAGKATLLRRLTFDLTGLPPTPAEVEAFLNDDSSAAYERVVDRLLASPAYGERWAQHWLDLARFAETDGFEHDLVRPNAWRYRDWVIDALNADMPYNEFLRLQIAGDELSPNDPQASIATGFLLSGPDMPDLNLQEERRHVVLNEMTATVGAVFLAMQFGCAQCHDHKYDPIRIQDFYRLRAFFEPSDLFRDHPIPTREELAARQAAEVARDPEVRHAEQRRRELEALGRERFRQKNPDVLPSTRQALEELEPDDRREHRQLGKRLETAPHLPTLTAGRVMRDSEHKANASVAHVYLRGDFRQPGPEVSCAFPSVLSAVNSPKEEINAQPRVALANWLASDRQPLVARVIVNRLWQWHFGVGLSNTASDFGTMGAEATHPELLDWLARRFVADGWSLKQMHRLMVTSRTYQLANTPFDLAWSPDETARAEQAWRHSQAIDPDNALLWHRRPLRLTGEAIRDAMLRACDQLSPRRGGPGIRPPLPPEVTETLLKEQWKVSGDEEDHRRRSIYLFVRRNLRYPMFDVFDRPDTNASCALRHESTTATQSLTQFNSEFSLQCARWLAGVVTSKEYPSREKAINQIYLRALGRNATSEELERGQAFLNRQAQRLRVEGRSPESLATASGASAEDPFAAAALVDYCLAIFNASEFLYID